MNLPDNIKLNDFGQENIKHLLNVILLSNICPLLDRGDVSKLIEKIYFDKEHPENHTLQYANLRSNKTHIRVNGEFVSADWNKTIEEAWQKCIDIVDKTISNPEKIEHYEHCVKRYNILKKIKLVNRTPKEKEEYNKVVKVAHAYNILSGNLERSTEIHDISEYIHTRKVDGCDKDDEIEETIADYRRCDPQSYPIDNIQMNKKNSIINGMYNGTNRLKRKIIKPL